MRFNSEKEEYQKLHDKIIDYLVFLKEKVKHYGKIPNGMLKLWFLFPEVKQAWLGFCEEGNSGSGLGMEFAIALSDALKNVFTDFGHESITEGAHLEKVCLIKEGVGKDNISDFTANLIKEYLCEYTQSFARTHINADLCKNICVDKVSFNYVTETWESKIYYLPYYYSNYVLLTPIDILRREETWINRADMLNDFEKIPPAIPDEALRFQINNYFYSQLSKKAKKKEKREAAWSTIRNYPSVLDYFIKYKEDTGENAVSISESEVNEVSFIFHQQVEELVRRLLSCIFRRKLDRDSGRKWTPIPGQTGH